MIKKILNFGFLLLIFSCSSNKGIKMHYNGSVSKDCFEAIQKAVDFLPTLKLKPEDYKLIEVKNLTIKGKEYKGPHFWYLTFKLKGLIPKDENGIIGAGGEVFILVDLKKNEAKLLGYGE